ncbi:mechanosensitive ion channel family protein [Chitinimonas lacunae]|uniref:Mechanosensitive ion channel family protein n=1 Tax=Chitinimonas lacunae TaxID=1963018 RepID=A0ABV8MJP7_9NEIS
MQTINYLLQHNSWESLAVAIVVGAAALLVLTLLRRLVCERLKHLAPRTHTRLDEVLLGMVGQTKQLILIVIAIYIGAYQLVLGDTVERALDRVLMVALMVQAGLWLSHAALDWLRYRAESSADQHKQSMATHMALVGFMAQMVIWVVVVLSILANLGFNISALIASLGIGGVAVALAVQNILGDLFASMSIALDKPFVAGDSIVVDTISGTVKQVGLKTTRVQADSGEEVVFANADLLKSRIRNYKRMEERRALFSFSVSYDTPPEKLRQIPDIVRDLILEQPDTRFDRASLKALSQSSLDYEVTYYMLKPAYALFMATQHAINISLIERFAEEGIRFAIVGQFTLPTLSAPQLSSSAQPAPSPLAESRSSARAGAGGQGRPIPAGG